jgi:hypothetical protein
MFGVCTQGSFSPVTSLCQYGRTTTRDMFMAETLKTWRIINWLSRTSKRKTFATTASTVMKTTVIILKTTVTSRNVGGTATCARATAQSIYSFILIFFIVDALPFQICFEARKASVHGLQLALFISRYSTPKCAQYHDLRACPVRHDRWR